MQINKKLEEILASAFMAGAYAESEVNQQNFEQWLKLNQARILALGKPRPLTKKKHTENNFFCSTYEKTKDFTCTEQCGVCSHYEDEVM